jgi:hypothetical protein
VNGGTKGTAHLTERELREIVMEEVIKHTGPIKAGLDRVTSTLRLIYSNGSGGPPGYLETARAEDNKRFEQLFEMKEQLDQTKEFLAVLRDREEQKEKRRRFWMGVLWKVGAPIGTGLIGLLSWGASKAAPVLHILWDDYLRAHPLTMERLKNMSSDHPDPAYAEGNHLPQDASGAVPQP